jgi:hypothetical protein
MGNDVIQKISDYLSNHQYLNLATVRPDNSPLAHTVGYASDGLTDNSVIEKVFGIMLGKFPQIKDLPQNPDYVSFKITPVEAFFLDNTVGFGHRDNITF